MILVSIVTPSYNQGRFIERTLHSVAMQRTANIQIEHLIFDAKSEDTTLDVLRNFSQPLTWVSEPDRGQAHAVNKGLRAAKGDIIGWLNSDDVYYPGAVERVVEIFIHNPEIDVVYGQADHIDLVDQPFEDYPTEPWDPGRLLETCYLCQPAVFFRRSVFEQFGPLDESLHYCMDYEYWLRLARGGAMFYYMTEKLAVSRLYADNKTLRDRVKVVREVNDMYRRTLGHVPVSWLFYYAYIHMDVAPYFRSRNKYVYGAQLLGFILYAAWHWNRSVDAETRHRLRSLFK